MAEAPAFLARRDLQALIDLLHGRGYRCLGPQVRDGAIVLDALESVDALPRGVRDVQAPGRYRLEKIDDERLFAWANPAQGLRPLAFRPQEALWRCVQGDDGALRFEPCEPVAEPVAVIGARACDIAGLYLQDRHFLRHGHADPHYEARRRALFIVAVHCTHPAESCFCAATDDGPRAGYGFDLALTELESGYLVEARSRIGQAVLAELPLREAADDELAEGEAALEAAARRQSRRLPAPAALRRLFDRLEDPRWAAVAARCLGCGNCTAVCPTCFCFREEAAPLDEGEGHVQHRLWDSCFDPGHSYIHGLRIRPDIETRYRQWLTHKLAGWQDQFGRPGCVGCGRCLTWCLVGIDMVAEAQALCGEVEDA